ncbi:hypothetical protein JTB14_008309 [Gonioctena quinquepunctata]|nr:hypothetical protein JTB14_008309 [Gonioctena quinquepunctata]
MIPLDTSVQVNVQLQLMTTSKEVKGYRPVVRQCYFTDERPLKYFRIYNPENCNLECLTNYTLNKCGCVGFYMPRIAKTVLDMKLTDVKKINKKGKNRISVEFKTFQAANELAKNEELKKKGYDVFIPINKVTCKGIVKPLDKEFSDEILKEYSEIKTPINCGAQCEKIYSRNKNRRI